MDAKHEGLQARAWGLRAMVGRFGLGDFGVAGGSVGLGCRFDDPDSLKSAMKYRSRRSPPLCLFQDQQRHSQ